MEKPAATFLAPAVALTVIVLAAAGVRAAVTASSGIAERMAYPFCHASILHALTNAWCLVAVARAYRPGWGSMAAAYAIAVTVPAFVLSGMPTTGMSGACFALIGMMVWRVRRKLFYNACALAVITPGFLFTNVNAVLHLWCLAAGEAVGFLNAPAPWRRK